MKKNLFLYALLCCYTPFIQTRLIIGDPEATTGNSFSFTIGFLDFDGSVTNQIGKLWVATNDASISTASDNVKEYGLCYVDATQPHMTDGIQQKAVPMANETDATIFTYNPADKVITATTAPNPIWGNAFSNFKLFKHYPLFTIASAPNIIYSTNDIKRAIVGKTETKTTDLAQYDFGATEEISNFCGHSTGIFVTHSTGGAFGLFPSFISLLQPVILGKNSALTNGATLPISVSTVGMKPSSSSPDLASFSGPTTLVPYEYNMLLGLTVTADSVPNSSAIGLCIIGQQIVSEVLTLATYPLISQTITETINTPISAVANDTVSVNNVGIMSTSTGLTYIVVASTHNANPQAVYAVPVITNSAVIADFTSIKNTFTKKLRTFKSRTFDAIATDPTQLDIAGPFATQLMVGGTLPLATGQITNLQVVGDAAYITIGNEYDTNQTPGVFSSQAIFAPEGYIIGWSPWKREFGTDQQVLYSYTFGNFLTGFYASSSVSSPTPSYQSLSQLIFSAQSPIAPFLNTASQVVGGIQSIQSASNLTNGFDNISLLIATGDELVTIGQNGSLDGGFFKPLTMTSSDVLSWSGQTVNNQKALVSSCIGDDGGTNHFILVGGHSGVSILTDDSTGVTWSGNLTAISDLNTGQTWKTVGNFKNVKKICAATSFCYVLTDTALYRFALVPSKFTSTPTALNLLTMFTSDSFEGVSFFTDMIIDNDFAILGTTNGLFTINLDTFATTQIDIPKGLASVSSLYVNSSEATPSSNFATLSNLYVVTHSFITQQAYVNRFLVQNKLITPLQDTLVVQPGSLTEGQNAYFIRFNDFMHTFSSQGAWLLASSYAIGQNLASISKTPFIQQFNAAFKGGSSSTQQLFIPAALYVHIPFIDNSNLILDPIKDDSSGALIVAGSFNAHAHA